MSIKMLMMKLPFGIFLGYVLFNFSFFKEHLLLFVAFIIPICACKWGGGVVHVNEYTYTHTNTPQIRKQNKKKNPFL